MRSVTAGSTVGEIIKMDPAYAAQLSSWGIGSQYQSMTLGEACAVRGIDLSAVLVTLWVTERHAVHCGSHGWTSRLQALYSHLSNFDHRYLWDMVPRLEELAKDEQRCCARRGSPYSSFLSAFLDLCSNLRSHVNAQQEIVVPLIRKLLEAERTLPVGDHSFRECVEILRKEHERIGSLLARLVSLSGDYAADPAACPRYNSLLQGAGALHSEVVEHIDEEEKLLLLAASQSMFESQAA